RHEALEGSPEEGCGRLLRESPLERARVDEPESLDENRPERSERECLSHEETLDHREHHAKRGPLPLPRVVAGARTELVDDLGREGLADLVLHGIGLADALWTSRRSSGTRSHRGPFFVSGLATETTAGGPDLFPSNRYVTPKGSGHGAAA